MKRSIEKQQYLIETKKKAKKKWLFYIHLLGYIILLSLIIYNFYIIEEGPYKNNIISLNLCVSVAWTVFIIIHGINVFKGDQIFKKSWEEKKIEEFLNKDDEGETKLWE